MRQLVSEFAAKSFDISASFLALTLCFIQSVKAVHFFSAQNRSLRGMPGVICAEKVSINSFLVVSFEIR